MLALGHRLLSFITPAMAATTWDLPLAWPDGNFHVENAKRFAEEVNKATGGEVTINIHPGGSLGFKGPEMLTATPGWPGADRRYVVTDSAGR